jgi:hypothetical protein
VFAVAVGRNRRPDLSALCARPACVIVAGDRTDAAALPSRQEPHGP